MNIKTLTDFKRYLSAGGHIQLVDIDGQTPPEKIAHPRTVEKMQTNSCRFTGGSWLCFPKASGFTAYTKDGAQFVRLQDDPKSWLIYKIIA